MVDVLGYPRMSTADQDVVSQSMRLTQAGAIKVCTDACSGCSMEWPGLDALLACAREGDTRAIIHLDLPGRSLSELLAPVEMLRSRRIALCSLEEKIDTNSAAGKLVFHVFGAIAHFERQLIAERTKDGITAARARGKRPWRQPRDADKSASALRWRRLGHRRRTRPGNSDLSDQPFIVRWRPMEHAGQSCEDAKRELCNR